jgi:Skp family chaperone for outer membrane proteins
MESARWTDEQIDRQMNLIDRRFDDVFAELRADREARGAEMQALRAEMKADRHALRADVQAFRAEMREDRKELRAEMQAGFADLRTEIVGVRSELHSELHALQRQSMAILGGFVVAMLSLLAAAQL